LSLGSTIRREARGFARGFLLRILVSGGVLAVVIIGLEAWFWFRTTPILRGAIGNLDGDWIFQSRVTKTFPVGMAESDLIGELRRQGYPDPVSFGGLKQVEFSERDIVCRNSWRITWKIDAAAKVSDIRGTREEICL
jgi:hypothetical protein